MGFAGFRLAVKRDPALRKKLKERRYKKLTSTNMIAEINRAFSAANIAQTKAVFENLFLDSGKNDNYHLGNLMPELVPALPRDFWYATCNGLDVHVRRSLERIVVRNLKRGNPLPLTVQTVKLAGATVDKLNFLIQETEYPAASRELRIRLEAKWLDNYP